AGAARSTTNGARQPEAEARPGSNRWRGSSDRRARFGRAAQECAPPRPGPVSPGLVRGPQPGYEQLMAYAGLSLEGKVAVVVGGTTGIGRALALGLAEAGASVVASSRRLEQVEETAKLIETRGSRTLRLTSDVTDRSSLETLRDKTVSAFGQVHI